MSGIGYNGDGIVTVQQRPIDAQSSPSICKIVEAGCVCNNAELKDNTLYGQPTEGALLSLAMKVISSFFPCFACHCEKGLVCYFFGYHYFK